MVLRNDFPLSPEKEKKPFLGLFLIAFDEPFWFTLQKNNRGFPGH